MQRCVCYITRWHPAFSARGFMDARLSGISRSTNAKTRHVHDQETTARIVPIRRITHRASDQDADTG